MAAAETAKYSASLEDHASTQKQESGQTHIEVWFKCAQEFHKTFNWPRKWVLEHAHLRVFSSNHE